MLKTEINLIKTFQTQISELWNLIYSQMHHNSASCFNHHRSSHDHCSNKLSSALCSQWNRSRCICSHSLPCISHRFSHTDLNITEIQLENWHERNFSAPTFTFGRCSTTPSNEASDKKQRKQIPPHLHLLTPQSKLRNYFESLSRLTQWNGYLKHMQKKRERASKKTSWRVNDERLDKSLCNQLTRVKLSQHSKYTVLWELMRFCHSRGLPIVSQL